MSQNFLSEACQVFLKRVAETTNMARNLDPNKADDFVTKAFKTGLEGRRPNLFSMLNEFTINGMISGLGTPIVNIVSNFSQMVLQPTLAVIKAAMKADGKAMKEATAMWSAMFDGFLTDMQFFKYGFKSGTPFDYEISARSLGMTDKQFREVMVEAGVPTDVDGNIDPRVAQNLLVDSYDYMTKAIPGRLGNVIRIPSKLTVAIDEYFKARLRNQKTMQLLSRKAQEDADAGKGNYDELYTLYKKQWLSKGDSPAYANKINEIFGDNSTALYDVRNYAKDNTFQTDLSGVLKKIQEARGSGSTVGETAIIQAIPFLRTPWNLVKEGVSYVPFAGYVFRPNQTKTAVRELMDESGELVRLYKPELTKMSKEDAVARQVLGFGVAASIFGMVENGMLTGSMPQDPAERARWENNGIPELSIKVGDRWISYAKIEPIATVMGIAADIAEFRRHMQQEGIEMNKDGEFNDKYAKEAMKDMYAAFKANILQKSFMEGFANLVGAMESPGFAENYLKSVAARGVPALSNSIARATDPAERESRTTLERLKARIPGLRQELPMRYPQYGEAVERDRVASTVGEITGIKVTPEQTEQQKYLEKIGVGISKPDRKINGVELDTDQYAYYMQRINKRTNDFLASIDLKKLSESKRLKNVRYNLEGMLKRIRGVARRDLIMAYPDLPPAILEEKLFQRGLD